MNHNLVEKINALINYLKFDYFQIQVFRHFLFFYLNFQKIEMFDLSLNNYFIYDYFNRKHFFSMDLVF